MCINCSEHTGLGRAASSLERREIQRDIDKLGGGTVCQFLWAISGLSRDKVHGYRVSQGKG